MPKDRIPVAHVTLGLEMGGQEKLLAEFARHADRGQFDLRFISLGGRGTLASEIEEAGWPVIHLDASAGWSPRLMLRLACLFHRWRVQVVHSHEDRPLIHAAVSARLAGVAAVVHTRHGRSPGLTRRQRSLVNGAARFVNRFVCVSNDSARLSVKHGVSARKVATIWNGIDLERYPYSGPCANGPMVCVARLSPEKGIDTLVRAAAEVVAHDPSFRLEVAGDGPCMPLLRELVGALKLRECVCLLGQVSNVSGLLARASAFVLPSLSEGIALTILEAMARGLPVVATQVGGTPEAVVAAETGLLVPPADASALAAAILRLRRDAQEAHAMGLAGRRRAERHFDIRHMVARYEALYLLLRVRPTADVSPHHPDDTQLHP